MSLYRLSTSGGHQSQRTDELCHGAPSDPSVGLAWPTRCTRSPDWRAGLRPIDEDPDHLQRYENQ